MRRLSKIFGPIVVNLEEKKRPNVSGKALTDRRCVAAEALTAKAVDATTSIDSDEAKSDDQGKWNKGFLHATETWLYKRPR